MDYPVGILGKFKLLATCPVLVLLEIAVHGMSEVEHLGAGNGGVGGAQEAL